MEIIVAGDSWTFGSEIKDPNLSHVKDWYKENNAYRIPKIWPTKLANLYNLSSEKLTNLSWPAASNDLIVRQSVDYFTRRILCEKKLPANLLFIAGFTSPERLDFYYNKEPQGWFTVWPCMNHDYYQTGINKFVKLYQKYLLHHSEFLHRYMLQIINLQSFLKQHNINYIFFQAFTRGLVASNIENWSDLHFIHSYPSDVKLNYSGGTVNENYNPYSASSCNLWEFVDEKYFYGKNQQPHSFMQFIITKDVYDVVMGPGRMHPTEYGHELWAQELYKFINERFNYEL